MNKQYDVALLGHYTKDTIISASGTRLVNGGAFNYGSHLAIRMGLKVAAITRLAEEDRGTVDELTALGVDTFVTYTPQSTCLTLEYPSSNPDERLLYVASTAGPFTPEEVEHISNTSVLIGPSIRGEVPLEVIDKLKSNNCKVSVDVQGFIRIIENGQLVYEEWPEKELILSRIDVLKTDAVEAEFLTGTTDIHKAAKMLADLGPKEVVLTHRNGLLVYADGEYFAERFLPKALVGRSGRGDTCIASYMIGRLTLPPQEATIFAAAATSLKLEAEGPFKRTKEEIQDLISTKYAK